MLRDFRHCLCSCQLQEAVDLANQVTYQDSVNLFSVNYFNYDDMNLSTCYFSVSFFDCDYVFISTGGEIPILDFYCSPLRLRKIDDSFTRRTSYRQLINVFGIGINRVDFSGNRINGIICIVKSSGHCCNDVSIWAPYCGAIEDLYKIGLFLTYPF